MAKPTCTRAEPADGGERKRRPIPLQVPRSFHWFSGEEDGLGVRTQVSGTEGIDASRAEYQRLKYVREGDHAQKMLGFIHQHQPMHLWVHRDQGGAEPLATAAKRARPKKQGKLNTAQGEKGISWEQLAMALTTQLAVDLGMRAL